MMTLRFPTDWIVKANDALARLADRPWALFVILLAVNTIARPYAGIAHDSRLYSVQVVNHVEGGAYADDLFFRYGSQDEYSLFSRLATPLVFSFGLSPAFFLIYLAGKALLIWGMMRLVQTLVPDRTAGVLALIYCMVVPIRYGGQSVLNVQETFVTPRMLAIALVLIGLDFMLRGRPVVSGLTLLFAAALHPLMAFGGLLIWGVFQAWQFLGGRAFFAVTAATGLLALVVLAYEPIGLQCFGVMDDSWRQMILHASSFNFPSEWGWEDWGYLAFQLAVAGVVLWQYRGDAEKARFVAIVTLVTLAGIVGTALAENLPYALLLQGQPYRALWILAFLHLAWAAWLFVVCAEHASQAVNVAACGLLAYLCCFDGLLDEMLFPVFVLPFAVFLLRGLESEPRDRAWLPHSLQASLVLGGIGWMVYKLLLLTSGFDRLVEKQMEMRDVVEIYMGNLGPITILLVSAWAVVRVGTQWRRRSAWWIAAGCLGLQTCFFVFPETDFYAEHCTRYRADLRRMRAQLHAGRDPSAPLPTVYCNLGCLDYVWLDLHSKSYFDWWQAGGFMFRREMAVEGQRRACLVAPFEVERYRKHELDMSEGEKESVGRFLKTDFGKTRLAAQDLARLCQEPNLDYVLLEQRFEGLYTAQHGRLFLYPCKEVRTALGLPHPVPVLTFSARMTSSER
jgi:hypothetical protein